MLFRHILIELLRQEPFQRRNTTATLPVTTLWTETYSSVTEVTTIERTFDLDTYKVRLLLDKDDELRTE